MLTLEAVASGDHGGRCGNARGVYRLSPSSAWRDASCPCRFGGTGARMTMGQAGWLP